MRKNKKASPEEAIVILIFGYGVAGFMLVNRVMAGGFDEINMVFIAVFAVASYGFWMAWRHHRLRRKEYHRALLDFRWNPTMTGVEFEVHCQDYLCLHGWDAKTTKATGDQGADVVAQKGELVVVIQCKKYSKPVGNRAVQEVAAAQRFYNAHVGVVVSNQSFTKAAQALACSTGTLLLHFTELDNLLRTCPPETSFSIP